MRDTRDRAEHLRDRMPLAVRGSSTQTFRSLGLFAEAALLFCGSYLLAEAMLSPLQAGTLAVIGGGLCLALATVLLFYLAWPTYAKTISRRQLPRQVQLENAVSLQGEPLGMHADARWLLEKEEELPGPM